MNFNISNYLITIIAIVFILIVGQSLLIPFVLALLLWFIVKEIKNLINRVPFIKKKFPGWLKNLLTSIFIIGVLSLIVKMLTGSIQQLSDSYNSYEMNLEKLLHKLNQTFQIDLLAQLKVMSGDFDFGSILSSFFISLTDIVSSTMMIIFYALFFFLEESNFNNKLKKIFDQKAQHQEVMSLIDKIEISVAKYLGLKTFTSLITGTLSFVVLLLVGVDSPLFWAFLIFILNFIPTVGSVLGTLFPAFFCLLQFGAFLPFSIVLFCIGLIQVLTGNILEPKLMGNSMNISPLIAIIALSLWGTIWGVTGMIISVPITVVLIIIFSHFPKTRAIAILLSEKGNVDN